MDHEKLLKLRADLEALREPLEWSAIKAWIAKAKPIFRTLYREHLEDFAEVVEEPAWIESPYFSSVDRYTGVVHSNVEEASAYDAQENAQLTSKARKEILSFLDGLLQIEFAHNQSSSTKGDAMPDPKKVFIIYGRNGKAHHEMEIFVRSLGLSPISFTDLRGTMGGSPTVAEIVEEGMKQAQGVIALITADEYAVLRPDFRTPHDNADDTARWQARPNVIFEAGMAFGRDRSRVVFVLLGNPKLFTDVAGIHFLRPTNEASGDRSTLRTTLWKGMKCSIDESSTAWMRSGDLESCVALPEVSPRDPF